MTAGTLKKMRVSGGGPPFLVVGARRVLYAADTFDAWVRSREHRSTSEYDAGDIAKAA